MIGPMLLVSAYLYAHWLTDTLPSDFAFQIKVHWLGLGAALGLVGWYFAMRRLNAKLKQVAISVDLHQRVLSRISTQQFDSFGAKVAHDLKRPLANLVDQTTVALLEENPTRRSTQLEQIKRDTVALGKTFDAILDIHRYQAKQVRPELKPVELLPLCIEMKSVYDDVLQANKMLLGIDVKQTLTVLGNAALLGRALSNLIENCIHHCPAGTCVELVVFESKNRAVIGVRDDGNGIDEGSIDLIFEQFVSLESCRQTEGNGLGLSMVKAVVELMNGEIKVENRVPRGVQFLMSFPILR